MRFVNILTASAALFTTTTFAAQATINNHCSSPVYMWVDGDILGEMNTINPGDNFTSDYETRASGGMSMKLATGTDIWSGISIAQVEYTAEPENLWYDLSLINGDPFETDFTKITPQTASESDSCTTIDCPAGFTSCADAYMKSSDNYATHACPANTDLVVDLCAPKSSSKREAQAARAHARDFSS